MSMNCQVEVATKDKNNLDLLRFKNPLCHFINNTKVIP